MSSVFKRSGRWYLRFKTAAGAWTQEVSAARTREEAKKLAAELELKHERIRRGTEVEPGDPTLTFGKLFTWWWESHGSKLSPTTVATKGPAMRKHVLPKLEALTLREVTTARLEMLFDELGETLTGSSVNAHRSMLRAIFARAAKRGLWIGPNPVASTEKRKEVRRDFDSLDVDEVPKVLEQLDDRWRPLFATAIYTGMRKGELAALRRADVDFTGGFIRVSRSWGSSTTKGRREATVPIAAPLRPYLEGALRSHKSDFVFPGPDGGMMAAETKLQHVLRRALARAGIARAWLHVCRRTKPKRCGFSEERPNDVSQPCPQCGFRLWPKAQHRKIRFHDLRATTATLLARSGAGLAVAQRVLRHSDPSLTSNIYTRVSLHQMREALDGIVPALMPAEPELAEEPAAAAVNAEPLAAPVLHDAESQECGREASMQPRALLQTSEWAPQVSNLRPLPCEAETPSVNGGAARALAMNTVPARPVAPRPTEPGVRRSSPFTRGLAAPVLHAAPKPLLTVRQVAEQLAVSTATVYALVERGELAHVRVSNAIRVAPADLAAYLARDRR